MSNSTIGIKIADGTYFPILERESQIKKKLVLTTVKDMQSSVQIDLYEGDGKEIADARYIGSLLIDSILEAPKGESEIELVVGIDESGSLEAKASDLISGESQSLNVSLETLSEDGIYDIPEFELGEDEFESPADSFDEDFDSEDETDDDLSAEPDDKDIVDELADENYRAPVTPEKRRPLMLALFILFGVAAVVALGVLLYKLFQGPTIPPLEAKPGSEQVINVAAEEAKPVKAETAVEASETPTPVETEEKVPEKVANTQETRAGPEIEKKAPDPDTSLEKAEGVWYWVRWGDTLWDISSSFYETPWLYGKIAQKNLIGNPDRIFAGTRIYIPNGQ